MSPAFSFPEEPEGWYYHIREGLCLERGTSYWLLEAGIVVQPSFVMCDSKK